jgi:hypothetical protein
VSEETFDIFSGAPEEHSRWVESVEGLASARRRMGQIATETPGKYFLLSGADQSILTQVNTLSGHMVEG